MNLKKSLVSFLNRNNYKYIIIVLIGIIILFLTCGNYNLVEGNAEKLSEGNNLDKTMDIMLDSVNGGEYEVNDIKKSEKIQDEKTIVQTDNVEREVGLMATDDIIVETFSEGMDCKSNYSNLGAPGSNSANDLASSTCNIVRHTRHQNGL